MVDYGTFISKKQFIGCLQPRFNIKFGKKEEDETGYSYTRLIDPFLCNHCLGVAVLAMLVSLFSYSVARVLPKLTQFDIPSKYTLLYSDLAHFCYFWFVSYKSEKWCKVQSSWPNQNHFLFLSLINICTDDTKRMVSGRMVNGPLYLILNWI